MRTDDMAKLGALLLSGCRWADQALLPAGFTDEIVRPMSAGGVPLTDIPCGLLWWVPTPRTYFASGHGGQLVWVHPPLILVIAVNSAASRQSAERGQALSLVRGPLFQAVHKKLGVGAGS